MKVAIIGPNLYDQSKGQFHVHTASCRDGKNGRKYPLVYRHEVDNVLDALDVAGFIYDFLDGDDLVDALNEFYFHGCTGSLARKVPA